MKRNTKSEDDMIRNILANIKWETPGEDFTSNIINRLGRERVGAVASPKYSLKSRGNGQIFIGALLIIAVVMGSLYGLPYFPGEHGLFTGFDFTIKNISGFIAGIISRNLYTYSWAAAIFSVLMSLDMLLRKKMKAHN